MIIYGKVGEISNRGHASQKIEDIPDVMMLREIPLPYRSCEQN
jgi:hypothetical protein